MSDSNEVLDESQVGGSEEAGTYGEAPAVDPMDDVRARIAATDAKLDRLLATLTQPQMPQPVAAPPAPEPVDLEEIAKDPVKLTQFVAGQTTKAVSSQLARQQWDQKAESEFGHLFRDPTLKMRVAQQAQELTGGDPSLWERSPQLTYRAAQLVAAQVKAQGAPVKKTPQPTPSSAPPRSGQPPATQARASKISEDDPRIIFARNTGMLSEADIEKLKSKLPAEYERGNRQKARTLTRERR